MQPDQEIRTRWLTQLFCTDPADRPGAEGSVRELYGAAALEPPHHYCWFESPFDAAWAVALLIEHRHRVWGDLVRAARGRRDERDRIDRVTAMLCGHCDVTSLDAARTAMGQPLGMSLQDSPAFAGLQPAIINARMGMRDDVSALFATPSDADDLYRAESRFWGGNRGVLISGLLCPTAGTLIGQSFFEDYSFWTMANDETAAAGGDAPPILRAAWTAARRTGPWWAFWGGAILSDRPAEIHTNPQALLHREDGPALVYRDGARVFAWNGLTVPEAWIMSPETLPSATFRGFDPTFGEWVKRRTGPSAARTPTARASGAIVDAKLPPDPDERLRFLRAHAGGTLPLFDRYVAGDHDTVWTELVALGDAVRRDPHAADALAVAYETMRRVDLNLRSVIDRLHAIGYHFGAPAAARSVMSLFRRRRQQAAQAHVAPGPRASDVRIRIEKRTGPLPLSLRAFFEVVGSVDLNGRHPMLAPRKNTVAEDPLIVYGVTEAWEQVDGAEEDDIDEIVLAPDDLHKAGTSGGDPYSIAVPDARADGDLLNERHGLLFVPYLRLCFRFGGFSGYDGQVERPAVIDDLTSGLRPF